jgi:hypothetical protein
MSRAEKQIGTLSRGRPLAARRGPSENAPREVVSDSALDLIGAKLKKRVGRVLKAKGLI